MGRNDISRDDVRREVLRLAHELCDPPTTAEDPLASGLLDSLALEQLINETEELYGILFDDEEIARENFDTADIFAGVVLANLAESPFHR